MYMLHKSYMEKQAAWKQRRSMMVILIRNKRTKKNAQVCAIYGYTNSIKYLAPKLRKKIIHMQQPKLNFERANWLTFFCWVEFFTNIDRSTPEAKK